MTNRSANSGTPPAVIILRATQAESAGALLNIAGLTVIERALRQLRRVAGLRLLIVTDGAIPLPRALRSNIEVHPVTDSDVDRQIASLAAGIGRESVPPTVIQIAADVVRQQRDPLDGGIRVIDEATRRRAEDAVFADLLRGDLGIVARYINKKVSFRITRTLLCRLPITPNQVTLGAAVIGLMGCLLIATGAYSAMVGGFFLAQVQSVLDGCDGELARVRFQQSEIGEWLDTVVDDFLNVSLLASMGIGLFRAGYGAVAAIASATGCAMFLFYNAVSYRELIRQGVGGELLKIRWKLTRGTDMKSLMNGNGVQRGRLARAILALGRRDMFIFSWMCLAILNWVPFALFWGVLIALSCFVTATGQLILPEPEPMRASKPQP